MAFRGPSINCPFLFNFLADLLEFLDFFCGFFGVLKKVETGRSPGLSSQSFVPDGV